MSAGTLISVEEYLNTTYRPDRDHVEGALLERNVGEHDHSWMQTLLGILFFAHERGWNVRAFVEQRVQVESGRFRVPDVCVVRKGDYEPIVTRPPVLCIEILSKDDTVRSMEERVNDYLRFGVPTVWVLDPHTRRGYAYTSDGVRREATDGVMRAANPGHCEIELPMSELAE